MADYRKQKADATWAKKDWVRRFPGPEPVGRVPSRDALDEVERTIFQLEAAGRQVPASLWSARTRLRVQVAEEEERERERLLRAYLEAKRQAFERFEQAAEEENRRTRAEAETLATVMTSLRTLVADAQVLEEERLRGLLPTDEEDATRTREVEELLAKLRKGREKALRFSGSKLSRYGATVQQDWMVHRTKLEALVPKD